MTCTLRSKSLIVSTWAKWPIRQEFNPVSVAWNDSEFFYSSKNEMQDHRRVTPSPLPPALKSPVPITCGWREPGNVKQSVLLKNRTQCPRQVLEQGPYVPESGALTLRPPSIPQVAIVHGINIRWISRFNFIYTAIFTWLTDTNWA